MSAHELPGGHGGSEGRADSDVLNASNVLAVRGWVEQILWQSPTRTPYHFLYHHESLPACSLPLRPLGNEPEGLDEEFYLHMRREDAGTASSTRHLRLEHVLRSAVLPPDAEGQEVQFGETKLYGLWLPPDHDVEKPVLGAFYHSASWSRRVGDRPGLKRLLTAPSDVTTPDHFTDFRLTECWELVCRALARRPA